MADSSFAATAGSGSNFDVTTVTTGAGTVLRPTTSIGDGATGASRAAVVTLADALANPIALLTGALELNWNGATWDRTRSANVFKTAAGTAAAGLTIWTPTSGKKFRLMAFQVIITQNAQVASAAIQEYQFFDGASSMPYFASVYVPTTAATTFGSEFNTGWISWGNGFLSAAANNVLTINIPNALTAGELRVNVMGVEE